MGLGAVVVKALGKEEHFVAIRPVDRAHCGTRRRDRKTAPFHRWKCERTRNQ
jgi:hypothetical protein